MLLLCSLRKDLKNAHSLGVKFLPKQTFTAYLVFFISGATGLIYEISWARQIGLLFGHTAQAAGVVLAAYFLGLAIGYWAAGEYTKKSKKALRNYALAELIVGFWSLSIPLLLMLNQNAFILSFLNHPTPFLQTIIRIGFVIAILLPGTVALGATLPFMAQFISYQFTFHQKKSQSKGIIKAYAYNTLGAFFGVVLMNTFLIHRLGVVGSSYAAALLSFFCAVSALVIFPGEVRTITEEKSSPQKITLLIYSVVFISGCGILGLEVLYTQLFALVSQNSTYNFSVVLGAFLVSLALGSFAVPLLRSSLSSSSIISLACLGGAIAIPLSEIVFRYLTNFALLETKGSFVFYLGSNFFIALFVILPPVALLATVLPATWALYKNISADLIGKLSALNTIAAVVGAIASSFLMIPFLGLEISFALLSLLYLIFGITFLYHEKKWTHFSWQICLYLFLFAFFLVLPLSQNNSDQQYEKVKKWNSAYGPIEVRQSPEDGLEMTQNLHYTLGSSKAETREKRQAHIPLLLHPNPKTIVFLGLGTGATANGALSHKQVQQIEVVELIPEVIEAAKFFQKEKNNIFNSPLAHIIINDARHYLYQSRKKYDVIVSDLFVPWHSQTGYLYTVEHYKTAKKRLAPQGIFCQWLPLYQMSSQEFEIIANSFITVFPHVSLWRGEENNSSPLLALIGSEHSWKINLPQLKKRLQKLASLKRQVQVKFRQKNIRFLLPPDKFFTKLDHFFSLYTGEWVLQNPHQLNTDEFPRVEFLAPISQHQQNLLYDDNLDQYYREVFARLHRKEL